MCTLTLNKLPDPVHSLVGQLLKPSSSAEEGQSPAKQPFPAELTQVPSGSVDKSLLIRRENKGGQEPLLSGHDTVSSKKGERGGDRVGTDVDEAGLKMRGVVKVQGN